MTYDTTRDVSPQTAQTDNAEKVTSELHGQHVLAMTLTQYKKNRPNREHRCGAGQIPSEGQVRTSHNSRMLERGKL